MAEPGWSEEQALGRLLLLQSTLAAAPDEQRLGEMLAHGLAGVPGVRGSAVCLEGRLHASTLTAEDVACGERGLVGGACPAACPASTAPDCTWLPLRTARGAFGSVVVRADLARSPYFQGAVHNTVNLAALQLESGRQRAALAALNAALEGKVRQRTAELEAANQALHATVAERARAAARLAEESERLAVTLQSIGDAVIATDARSRVTLLNGVAEALTGWTAAEAIGRPLDEVFRIVSEETGLPVPSPAARVLAEGGVVGLANHTALRSRGGSERPIADSGAPIRGPGGAVAGVVLVFRDQTEERRLQEQLRQAQKLESIGRLAGGVAHDFNNLLTVIVSSGESLQEQLDAARPPLAEDVEAIREAGRRAGDLTRQLLAFARKQVIAPAPLDLNELLRGSARLLRRVLGEDVAVTLVQEPGLWPVYADRGQLEQVVLNLALNARDAMPGGGRLDIATANLELGATPIAALEGLGPGPHVRLSVSDTGVGMSTEVRQHLFEPFFTTKARGHGTGLGLATVYGIVRQMDGSIRVESMPGQGSRFEILLPRATRAPTASATPDAAMALGREAILVVEDDPSVRRATQRMLLRAGYRVEAVADGPAALAALAGPEPVDLVVCDVVMPGMNGLEVAEALRRLRPSLKVILISGYTDDAIARLGDLRRGVEFLQKPFTPATLTRRVREALDAAGG